MTTIEQAVAIRKTGQLLPETSLRPLPDEMPTEADRAASASIDHCQTCANLRFGKQADKRKLAEHLKQAHDVILVWMESVK
jgi:hypothetical protein